MYFEMFGTDRSSRNANFCMTQFGQEHIVHTEYVPAYLRLPVLRFLTASKKRSLKNFVWSLYLSVSPICHSQVSSAKLPFYRILVHFPLKHMIKLGKNSVFSLIPLQR